MVECWNAGMMGASKGTTVGIGFVWHNKLQPRPCLPIRRGQIGFVWYDRPHPARRGRKLGLFGTIGSNQAPDCLSGAAKIGFV
jgi:hypothetical protein